MSDSLSSRRQAFAATATPGGGGGGGAGGERGSPAAPAGGAGRAEQAGPAEQPEQGPWCALGSIKGNLGHANCAAGITGLIKAVLCLKHKALVPTAHFERLR